MRQGDEIELTAPDKEQENQHKDHRQRVRNRFRKEGLKNFEPHNILELLLFFAIPRKDTNVLAHQLIDRFGSLSEVLNAPAERLMEIKGISENAATLLTLIPELSRAYVEDLGKRQPISGVVKIKEYLFDILRSEVSEKVMLVCMDNRMDMLSADIISEGSVSFSVVDKRRIIDICLRHNATKAIIAHNHPRGRAIPSQADKEMTIGVRQALNALDVVLVDHVIVATDACLSMANDDRFSALF